MVDLSNNVKFMYQSISKHFLDLKNILSHSHKPGNPENKSGNPTFKILQLEIPTSEGWNELLENFTNQVVTPEEIQNFKSAFHSEFGDRCYYDPEKEAYIFEKENKLFSNPNKKREIISIPKKDINVKEYHPGIITHIVRCIESKIKEFNYYTSVDLIMNMDPDDLIQFINEAGMRIIIERTNHYLIDNELNITLVPSNSHKHIGLKYAFSSAYIRKLVEKDPSIFQMTANNHASCFESLCNHIRCILRHRTKESHSI